MDGAPGAGASAVTADGNERYGGRVVVAVVNRRGRSRMNPGLGALSVVRDEGERCIDALCAVH